MPLSFPTFDALGIQPLHGATFDARTDTMSMGAKNTFKEPLRISIEQRTRHRTDRYCSCWMKLCTPYHWWRILPQSVRDKRDVFVGVFSMRSAI